MANLELLNATLRSEGFIVSDTQWRWVPQNTVLVDDPDRSKQLLKLLELLEALDDVQTVTANFDLADELFDRAEVI